MFINSKWIFQHSSEKGLKSFTIKRFFKREKARQFALLQIAIILLHLLSLWHSNWMTLNPCGESRQLSFHLKTWNFAYWRRFMRVLINHFNYKIVNFEHLIYTHARAHKGKLYRAKRRWKKLVVEVVELRQANLTQHNAKEKRN